jgi:hypothetical protein
MILLITLSGRAGECVAALQETAGEPAQWVDSFRQASNLLREQEFSAVILDENMLEIDPDGGEVMLQHCGAAAPIYVNLAICGKERLLRELRLALQRRKHDQGQARRTAEAVLRSEVNGPLTALLLSCQLVLEDAGLPPTTAAKIRSIYEIATEIRNHLEKN